MDKRIAAALRLCTLAGAALLAGCGGGSGADTAGAGLNTALSAAPAIPLYTQGDHWLQVGNANDAYWVSDNPWGAGGLTEGPGANQYEQQVGIGTQTGPNGEVAFRTKWRWPLGTTEVKGYPAILSGRKPGYASPSQYVDGKPIRLPDGSFSTTAPSGATPGTYFPLQLPLQNLTSTFNYEHLSPATGQGQLVYDLWLQSSPQQDQGFGNASITHEIMIVLDNWGNYGGHGGQNGRNPNWYDHDAVIDGRTYHVYVTKGSDGAFLYNFGSLNGNHGRTGWKMIAFLPAQLPVPAGEINLASFVNYLATRTDVHGNRWANGNEYLASVELGVEPVEGTGDIAVYDYKVSQSGTTPPPGPVTRVEAEAGTLAGTGVSVKTDIAGYEGSGFVGSFENNGDSLSVNFAGVTAGNYDLRIRYHAWTAQRNGVAIDGGTVRDEAFAQTGNAWATKTISGLNLAAGTHTVAITKDWGWIHVDYLELVPAGSPPGPVAVKLEAEAGVSSGSGVGARTDHPGFEGTAFVGNFTQDGDTLTLTFPGLAAGTYDVRIRYQAWTQQQNDVLIDGVPRDEAFAATGQAWQVKTLAGVAFAAGTHTLAVRKNWGYVGIDWIEVVPVP